MMGIAALNPSYAYAATPQPVGWVERSDTHHDWRRLLAFPVTLNPL
jgi:hypothetical protein